MNRMAIKSVAMATAIAALMSLAACGKDDSANTTTMAPIPAATNAAPAAQQNPVATQQGTRGAEPLKEGKSYKIVSVPSYKARADGKILVKEYFWYGCPHCYRALPKMEEWMNANDTRVAFEYTPAPANPAWEIPARLNYALQMQHLSEGDRKAVFEAIHKDGVPPNDKDRLIGWAASHGWNEEQLKTDWDSFAVTTEVEKAKKEITELNLEGVPVIVINGKYQVSIENALAESMTEADLATAAKQVVQGIEDGQLPK